MGPSVDKLANWAGPTIARRPTILIGALRVYARTRGCTLVASQAHLTVWKGKRGVRISRRTPAYVRDVVDDFAFYYEAVDPVDVAEGRLVDYSEACDHQVRGWDQHLIRFPGLPDPIATAEQYLALSRPRSGDVVMDLGAYGGLTALVFQQAVGSGRVIAVEADHASAECARINFERFSSDPIRRPLLIEAAVWSEVTTLQFAAEASLGSAVADLLPRSNETTIDVRTVTPSNLAEAEGLSRVNVIKADIEGAEFQAFSDAAFFESFHPRIVFEPANNRIATTRPSALVALMEGYGYQVSFHAQVGSRLPLMLCE